MSACDAFGRLLAAVEGGNILSASKDLQSFSSSITEDLKAITELGLGDIFLGICEETVNNWIRDDVVPMFWGHLSKFRQEAEENGGSQGFRDWLIDSLTAATEETIVALQDPQLLLDYLATAVGSTASRQPLTHWIGIHASVASPEYFHDAMAVFFHTGFKGFHDAHDAGSELGPAVHAFARVCVSLRRFNILEAANSAFAFVLFGVIDRHLRRVCDSDFSESKLSQCEGWLEATVLPWIAMVCGGSLSPIDVSEPVPVIPTASGWEPIDDGSGGISGASPARGEATLFAHLSGQMLPGPTPPLSRQDAQTQLWERRVRLHLYESMCGIRTAQMFDIIRDYPDSVPVLQELKSCLDRTMLTRPLCVALKAQFSQRLLHPGANTSQILEMFISSIRSLAVVDPSGVLFEMASPVIKHYLRSRKDTIRCIVTSLTEDTESELFAELMNRKTTAMPQGKWFPDPIDVDTSDGLRQSDLISTLIGVYGSKEVFVNEYRSLLSERLLAKQDFDTEQEVRTLELLKLRFGETAFNQCEIMIKDMAESKRVANVLQSATAAAPVPVHATIVSGHFWPPLSSGEAFEMHPQLKGVVERYQKSYADVKKPRKLEWVPHQGTVELDICAPDGTAKTIKVSQLHATLLLHFQDQESWCLSDLSKATGLPPAVLRRKMQFWTSQGVVSESNADGGVVFVATDSLNAETRVEAVAHEAEDAVDAIQAEAFRVYESFVFGMLRNFGGLPLDRIHNMLKMFVTDHTFTMTPVELQRFLMTLVHDDKLQLTDGVYKLK